MEVVILLIFVSLVLVVAALGLYVVTLRQRTYEHSDRLALLPLESESPRQE